MAFYFSGKLKINESSQLPSSSEQTTGMYTILVFICYPVFGNDCDGQFFHDYYY